MSADTGDTKYGHRIDEDRWHAAGRDNRPQITTHARQRWAERLPAGVPSLDEALDGAVPIHEALRPAFQTGEHDEPRDVLLVRTHGDHRTADAVILVNDEWEPPGVVTVFTVDSKYDRSLRAYCRARLDNYPERPEEETDE